MNVTGIGTGLGILRLRPIGLSTILSVVLYLGLSGVLYVFLSELQKIKNHGEPGVASAHGLSSLRRMADLHGLSPGRPGKKEAAEPKAAIPEPAKEGIIKKIDKPKLHGTLTFVKK